MADLGAIEIPIVVRQRGLKESITLTTRLEREITRAVKAAEEQTISQDRLNKVLLSASREYRTLGVNQQRATAEVRKFAREKRQEYAATKQANEAAREAARVAREQAASNREWFTQQRRRLQMMEESKRLEQQQINNQERIRERYLPLYAASKKYERALEEINQANREGVLTDAQRDRALENLNQQFNDLHNQSRGNIASQNSLGVAIQQTGYQVGDFFVQIQSGTDALVAFGQQATQLVGVLPLIHTQLGISEMAAIALSTGLGIAIPIITAAANVLFGMQTETKSLSDSLEELKGSLDSATESLELLKDTDLDQTFGSFSDGVANLTETMLKLDQAASMKNLLVVLEKIKEASQAGFMEKVLQGFENISAASFGLGEFRGADKLDESIYEKLGFDKNLSIGLFQVMSDELALMARSGDMQALQAHFERIVDLASDGGESVGGITLEGHALLRTIYESAKETARFAAELDGSAESARRLADAQAEGASAFSSHLESYNKFIQAQDDLNKSHEESVRLFEQDIALLRMALQFGEDSLAVSRLEDQQEQENLKHKLKALGYSEDQVDKQVELLRVQQGVTEELRQSEAASSGLNNSLGDAVNAAINLRNALADADSAIQSLGLVVERKIAVIRARNLAIQQGTNESVAGEVALLKQKRNEITQNLAASGASIDQIAAETEEVSAQINEYEKLRGENVKLRESMKTTGKSGGRAMKEVEDSVRTVQDVFKDAIVTAEEFELQMAEGVVSAVDSVANAWGDFVMRGFQDFKGFVASVWSSFKSLISNMIATAAKNRIMLSIGATGGGAAGAAGGLLGGGGGLGNAIGAVGQTMAGGGFLGGVGSGLAGVFSGGGLGSSFANLGGLLSGSVGGAGAIGAALPAAGLVIGIPLLIAGLMKKTEVTVANGVRAVIDGAELAIDSYEKTKTNNGLGFSSGFSREFTRLDDAVQDAVSARIGATVQNLGALGLGTNLTGFSFSKRTEVKEGETFEGESEEVIRAALDAAVEFATQGALDGFTRTGETLSETLDRLVISLQAANPVLQLLGGSALDISVNGADAASKLIELSGGLEAFAVKSDYLFQNFLTLEEQQTRLADAAKVVISDFEQFYNVALPETHAEFMALVNAQDLNTEAGRQLRAALQDVADEFITVKGTAEEAVGALRDLGADTASFESAIRQQQSLISRAVDALVKPLQEALDRTKTQAERSFRIFSEAADKTRDEAQSIVDILTDVISSRVIQSEAVERMRYQQAQQQLESFAGGADFTPDQLRRATEGVDIDTTKFFGSFEDYARDFYRTQISLTKLADKAEGELTDVEKQIDIAEKAYEVALGTYQESQDFNTALNQLITDLAVYTETAARNEPFIEQIKAEGDRQVELLDQILVETKKQVNEFLGLETSLADLVGTNVSVGEALEILGKEGSDLSGAVMALEPVVDTIGSHIAELDLTLGGAVDRLGLNLEDLVSLDLTAGFENLDLFKPLADMDFGEKFKPVLDSLSEVDFSGPISEQIDRLLSLDIVGDLQEPLSGLQSKISFLDETASGLNLGVVGLDGSVALLSSSVGTHSENLLTLNGTIVDDLGVKLENLGTNTGTLKVEVGNLSTSTGDLSLSVTNFGETFSSVAGTLTDMVSDLSSSVSSLAGAQRAQAAAQQSAAQAAAAQAAADAARSEQIRSPLVDTAVETYVPNTSSGVDTGSRSLTSRAFSSLVSGASFATGGMHIGGMRLVGEQGPELEVTGPSRIYSAQQTKNMLSGGSSEAASEIRMLRREVSELRAEQRKIGVENVKYNKKSYDLNREWDIVGLPATRT